MFGWICSKISGAPLYSRLQASPTSIRLDCKGLPGTNALAYYKNSQITAAKCFLGLGPGIDCLKLFGTILLPGFSKLDSFVLKSFFNNTDMV
jgi:hypothetical protein